MVTNRAFSVFFAASCAVLSAPAAQAEVFEIAGNGALVEITKQAWQPPVIAMEQNYAPLAQTSVLQTSSARTTVVQQHIQYAASRYGISSALVDAVAWQESRYNNHARSSAGAIGVMQLMPGTARNLGVVDPTDVHQNIMGGTAYLRAQLDRFGNNIPLALAAYNAGPAAVQKYGGVPPYRETQNYVRQIMGRMAQTASLYSGN
jgi:soluble lytic murein transglycosylase-like protein